MRVILFDSKENKCIRIDALFDLVYYFVNVPFPHAVLPKNGYPSDVMMDSDDLGFYC